MHKNDELCSKIEKLIKLVQTISDKAENSNKKPNGKLYYFNQKTKKSLLVSHIYIDEKMKVEHKEVLNEIDGKWFKGQDSPELIKVMRTNNTIKDIEKKMNRLLSITRFVMIMNLMFYGLIFYMDPVRLDTDR